LEAEKIMGKKKNGRVVMTRRGPNKVNRDVESIVFQSVPILIPCGECPIKLEGTEHPQILDWAKDVILWGKTNGRNFTKDALRYWVRDFYEVGSKEHNSVRAYLATLGKPEEPSECAHDCGNYLNGNSFYCNICRANLGAEYYRANIDKYRKY
jgi:hypothetical protein